MKKVLRDFRRTFLYLLKIYKKIINMLNFLFYYVEFDDTECYNYIDNLGKLCPIANLNFYMEGISNGKS